MSKKGNWGTPLELAELCYGIVSAQCLSLRVSDVKLALKKIGIDASWGTVQSALEAAANAGWIEYAIDSSGKWVFYSEEWIFGRK